MFVQRTYLLLLLSIFCCLLPPTEAAVYYDTPPPVEKKKKVRQGKKRFRLFKKKKRGIRQQQQTTATAATVLIGLAFVVLMLAYIIGAVLGIFIFPGVLTIIMFIGIIIWSLLGVLASIFIIFLGDYSSFISLIIVGIFSIPTPIVAGLVLGLPWLWIFGLSLLVLAVLYFFIWIIFLESGRVL